MTTVATVSLAIILMSMVLVMLLGLFHDKVDNNKVFELLAPAFQTIVGGFIGLITGIKIGEAENETN
jgi:ABC-type arginine transport system permease subunit